MATKYQFNKVSMQAMQKQLKIRENALPILKSKESVLRLAEKKQKALHAKLQSDYKADLDLLEANVKLWAEFPQDIYAMKNISIGKKKIAGIYVPDIKNIDWKIGDFSSFTNPLWVITGVRILQDLTRKLANMEVVAKGIEIIEKARKKTTQKVNLYEKVQIPEYTEAIRKIKNYLEDVGNLDKAVQKITKQRNVGE